MDFFLFGDQTGNQRHVLEDVLSRKRGILLSEFVNRSSETIREEIGRLPRARNQAIPSFRDMKSFIEDYYTQNEKVCELESSLLTLSQLLCFIGYAEGQSEDHFRLAHAHYVAPCTGSIAAVAIMSASSLVDLVPLASEAIRIAFRVGTVVNRAKENLVNGRESAEAWSTIVSDTTKELADSALSERDTSDLLNIPIYLSAVGLTNVTISGPPHLTKRFFESSSLLRTKSRSSMSIYGPYHSTGNFRDMDIDNILQGQPEKAFRSYTPKGYLFSSSSGTRYESQKSIPLLRAVLEEMLRDVVRWDLILERVITILEEGIIPSCRIVEVGQANCTGSLLGFIKQRAPGVQTFVQNMRTWSEKKDTGSDPHKDNRIAIIGMSGRFPDAADHEALWQLLIDGLDVHREVPADRFDVQTHCDSSGKGKNKSHTPYGCFIDDPGLFDARFFNMSPREATQTDPIARLALVTAYEALEMSGFVPNRTPSTQLSRIGTFYGQTSDDWREINAAEDIDTYFITGGVRAFAPGRINYYFKFSGPSYSVDTACSSSLAAIQLACTSLLAGECDMTCAGGLNLLTNPDIFSGLSKGQFLSKSGSCKTFDNEADGYCRGEGCGTIILKRYQDAIADKDNILGSILGTATNHSAEAVSITHPHTGAQKSLFRGILSQAGVDAHEITYVEMHGTGTQAGDSIEMASVTETFAPKHRQRSLDQPLYLGAIKSNIGHGEAVSGVSSLIKCLLMLREGRIPPNVGIKGEINRAFPDDLAKRQIHIPRSSILFPSKLERKRKIFINNFSAAGGNTGMLIEEGPSKSQDLQKDPRTSHVVTLSAKGHQALINNIKKLIQYIELNPDTDLSSLSYTTTSRRIHHNHRVAISILNLSELKESLGSYVQTTQLPMAVLGKMIFCFSGQGGEQVGFAQRLYQDLPPFRDNIDQMCFLSSSHGLPSFAEFITGTPGQSLSPVVTQVGLVCIQVALARMWISWGVKPVGVVGHSLGEYAALNIAGVLSTLDMILLVSKRAQLLVDRCTPDTHGMLAVGGSVEAITRELGSRMLEVACKNGAGETVLTGSIEHITTAQRSLSQAGFRSTVLEVPFAFHSSQIDPILGEYESVASRILFQKPTIPIMSPLKGDVIRDYGKVDAAYLARHARETVDFASAIQGGLSQKLFDDKTTLLEIGPHNVCSKIVEKTLAPLTIVTIPSLRRGVDVWKTITAAICILYSIGVDLDFQEYHQPFNESHKLLNLPTYSFDNKRYWLDYHNDWCLTKGQTPKASKAMLQVEDAVGLSTTSCQTILNEDFRDTSATVLVQSDITEPHLLAVIQGHMVNGAALCPSTVYADMALTISNYIWRRTRPQANIPGFNIASMIVQKPLIAQLPPPLEGQYIQVLANADLQVGQINLTYNSVSSSGSILQNHAQCIVNIEEIPDWISDWTMIQSMVVSRVNVLEKQVHTGEANLILRGMAYKLFQALVTYDRRFRGMEEVILSCNEFEATASIKFQAGQDDGTFFCSPYWIDSLCHLSGFILNATDLVDSSRSVFISHGWESLRFSRSLSPEKKYRSYVRMEPRPNNIRAGNVYIFEDDELIGVVGGVKFQLVPRKLLNTMLPPNDKISPASLVRQHMSAETVTKTIMVPQLTRVSTPISSLHTSMMEIISKETEVEMSQLVDDITFESIGVDSLMTLAISAEFREKLSLEFPPTLFFDYPTVGAVKKYFTGSGETIESTSSDDGSSLSNGNTSSTKEDFAGQSPPSTPGNEVEITTTTTQHTPRSYLLQGNPKTASKILFLFPDGSGSATSYLNIATVSSSTVAIYGLDCPFMKSPENFVVDFIDVCASYMNEVMRRQPQGPYFIGGWSAGGVVAYEVAVQLIAKGQTVENLILIDSPCPVSLAPLPTSLFRFLDRAGLLGSGGVGSSPKWLVPHFEATVRALATYTPAPIFVPLLPKTTAIWAREGVCGSSSGLERFQVPGGDEIPIMKWLLDDRDSFDDNGWAQLLGSEMSFKVMEANHFTMMSPDHGSKLAALIKACLQVP